MENFWQGRCASLTHLNLQRNFIGDDGVECLAKVLAECKSLSRLDLGENDIAVDGAQWLAKVVPQCPSLSYLDLGENYDIGDQGAEYLAEALRFASLTSLILTHDDIGDPGAGRLATVLQGRDGVRHCTALVHLDLGSNCISSEVRASITSSLKRNKSSAQASL